MDLTLSPSMGGGGGNRYGLAGFGISDEYTTARAAGEVNGTACEPGVGTRTIIDTEGKITITDGKLVYAGGKTVPAYGDPGDWLAAAITRAPGIIGACKVTLGDATRSVSFGFDDNKSTNVTRNSFNISSDTVKVYDSGTLGPTVLIPADSTEVTKAVILRAAGAFFFLKLSTGYWKMSNQEGRPNAGSGGFVLDVKDLSIGGEGLKDTYDKRLPALFKRYGKEKVSSIDIRIDDKLKPVINLTEPISIEDFEADSIGWEHNKSGVDVWFTNDLDIIPVFVNIDGLIEDSVNYKELEGKKLEDLVGINLYDKIMKSKSTLSKSVPFIPITDKTRFSYPQYQIKDKTKYAIQFRPGSTASQVDGMFNRTLKQMEEREQVTWDKIKKAFVRGVVDFSGNIKARAMQIDPVLGKQVVMHRELLAGAVPKANSILERSRDKMGKGLNKEEVELRNRVIQARRTIAIDKYRTDIQHPENLGGSAMEKYLDSIKKQDPALFQKVNNAASEFFKATEQQLKERFNAGLLTQQSYNELSKHEYSLRQFMQYLDPVRIYTFSNKTISVTSSGIKPLDEGSIKLLMDDADKLIEEITVRTQTAIFRNKANKALYDIAVARPNNPLVKIAAVIGQNPNGTAIYQKAPAGYDKIGVMINGIEQEMILPSEMAEEWVKSDPLINEGLANMISWISGAKPLKAIATGYNPGFILSNIPRDIALIWGTTKEYSKHLPIATGQFLKDFISVAPDVFSRSGRVMDFVNEGGIPSFLTYYGRFSGKGFVGKSLQTFGDYLGWIGETSELWSRMALRERAIQNGKSSIEATWEARRYLDFAQGGNIAKALDVALPYFNAGIQGTRSTLRAATKDPGLFTYKMAQLGIISIALYKYFVNNVPIEETILKHKDIKKENKIKQSNQGGSRK